MFVEKILPGNELFIIKEEKFPFNDFPLHIHPEYELILILKGNGKRYVGDHIGNFLPGDLCLFGPHLPHTFYNKHLPTDREICQIVLQFNTDCLGQGFFEQPAFQKVQNLFDLSIHGIAFKEECSVIIKEKLTNLIDADQVEKVAGLVSILGLLAKEDSYELLSTFKAASTRIKQDTERMNLVYHYLLEHFKQGVQLHEVAAVAHLSPAAFCRYFKKHTRKTLSAFINELRITNACKLLQQKERNVLEICYESGFNNISYFNRQFKSYTGLSPLKYQRKTGY